ILAALAPKERCGYPRAHLELAKLLMYGGRPATDEETRDNLLTAEKHLQFIKDQDDPDGVKASLMLGEYYLLDRRPSLAVPLLRRAPLQSPERVYYAVALGQAGDQVTAESEARVLSEGYAAKLY